MVVNLLELIPTKKTLTFLEILMKYLDTLSNLVSKMSTKLLGLEFKSDNIIKIKAIKFIVKKILPEYK